MFKLPCIDVKIVLLGGSGVGKSSIIARLMSNDFSVSPMTTLGAAFATQMITIQGTDMKFQIWDTAGQERYKALLPLYYRDTQVAIIVYDISNFESFEQLKYWVNQLKETGPVGLITVLVGNKIDMINDENMSKLFVTQYAERQGFDLLFCSCQSGEGVKELFDRIGDRILKNVQMKSQVEVFQQSDIFGSVKLNYSVNTGLNEQGQARKENKCC